MSFYFLNSLNFWKFLDKLEQAKRTFKDSLHLYFLIHMWNLGKLTLFHNRKYKMELTSKTYTIYAAVITSFFCCFFFLLLLLFFFLLWFKFFIWVLHFACWNVARIFAGVKFCDFFCNREKREIKYQLGIQILNQHNHYTLRMKLILVNFHKMFLFFRATLTATLRKPSPIKKR